MWDQASQELNQSMARMLGQLANLLPGVLALIVAVLFAAMVALLLTFILRRFLNGVRFDERLARWGFSGIADWSPKKSPTLLVTRVVGWLVVIVGFLIGTTAFDAIWTSQVAGGFIAYLPNIVGAGLVLVAGNIIARVLARSVLIGAVNMNLQYSRLLSMGVKWLVIVLSVAM